MGTALVGDRLWARTAPLLPKRRRSPKVVVTGVDVIHAR